MQKQYAFSLVELSIVILVIGILIAGIVSADLIVKKSKLITASNTVKNSVISSIPDLAFWGELTSEDAYDDSATANSVATWYDITPYASSKNDATQATAANRPTYTKSAINGLPALRFDGVNDSLSINSAFMDNHEYSLFIVEQRRASTSGSYFYSPASFGVYIGYATDTEFRIQNSYGGNDWYPFTIASYSSPTPKIISVLAQPVSSTKVGAKVYFNGALQYNNTAGNINYGSSSTYNIGKAPYNGDIGEILIFKRCLKASERADIEQYLAKKWRITI